jgi:hypothetical protein
MTPDLFTAPQRASSTPRASTAKRGKRVPFIVFEGETTRRIEPFGRDAWALAQLIGSGSEGCTPLTHVGPRWSAYIFKLKKIHGLVIETVHEGHGGEFKGTHGRYILRSRVQFADPADAARHGGDL